MIYVLVGVPASGKSYVCEKLKDKFVVCEHDKVPSRQLYTAAVSALAHGGKTVIAEAPFNAQELVSALIARRHTVHQVLVTASLPELEQRYLLRAGKSYPPNFRTNHYRYLAAPHRFLFSGTGDAVVAYLSSK